MTKTTKIITLCIFSLSICFLSYHLCYLIAEKFFFDKFFYYKSIEHGYLIPKKAPKLSYFGKRAEDLITLENNQPISSNDSGLYRIVIIGDSYVWGQGIRNSQRFAEILEDKLSKIKPVKIYSLGYPGDNIFDNYVKYNKSKDVFGEANLYIFGLVYNDLIFNNHLHTSKLLSDMLLGCDGIPSIDVQNVGNEQYRNLVRFSLDKQSLNNCTYTHLLPILPKNKTIYINLSNPAESDISSKFSQITSRDLNAIQPIINPNLTAVSTNEKHPSSFANQMFADTLFQEITTNAKWGFKH